MIHGLAADVGDLFTGHFGDVLEFGHGLDEVIHREGAGLVAGISLGGLGAGNGAAGGEDFDLRERPGSRSKS